MICPLLIDCDQDLGLLFVAGEKRGFSYNEISFKTMCEAHFLSLVGLIRQLCMQKTSQYMWLVVSLLSAGC